MQIKKQIIDNFEPGRGIPYFALSMKPKSPRSPSIRIFFGGVDGECFLTLKQPKFEAHQGVCITHNVHIECAIFNLCRWCRA